jgi:hypothetical protein
MQNDFMLFDNKAFMSNIPINENKFTKYIGLFLVVTSHFKENSISNCMVYLEVTSLEKR